MRAWLLNGLLYRRRGAQKVAQIIRRERCDFCARAPSCLSHLRQDPLQMPNSPDPRSTRYPSIAIIGMGARFAGAEDLAAFERLLYEGRCAIGDLPPERLHPRYYDPTPGAYGKSHSRVGGWIDRFVGGADDPMQRWTLEVARAAFADAGLDPETLEERNVAVIVGNGSAGDYEYDQVYRLAAADMVTALADVP